MQSQMTYTKAKKLNAIFLLLLLATEKTATNNDGDQPEKAAGSARSQEYFEQKLREFERDKYRF